MAKVTIRPSGLEFEAAIGDTVMAAAQAHGLYWPTTCGGQGECTTCLSEVQSGLNCLSEMGRSERKTLINDRGEAMLRRPMRLMCQATIIQDGEVELTKNGVHGKVET